ncbi:hypothetical protein NADE_008573 [Nannochloris sp. 'desiccata']|nr:hypothetical protein NADE_008573 [Chlorella desiccata (nom. nud.)]
MLTSFSRSGLRGLKRTSASAAGAANTMQLDPAAGVKGFEAKVDKLEAKLDENRNLLDEKHADHYKFVDGKLDKMDDKVSRLPKLVDGKLAQSHKLVDDKLGRAIAGFGTKIDALSDAVDALGKETRKDLHEIEKRLSDAVNALGIETRKDLHEIDKKVTVIQQFGGGVLALVTVGGSVATILSRTGLLGWVHKYPLDVWFD